MSKRLGTGDEHLAKFAEAFGVTAFLEHYPETFRDAVARAADSRDLTPVGRTPVTEPAHVFMVTAPGQRR